MAQTAKIGSRLVIVTGGPGSGKSSLVSALADAGFRTMPEAGRGIILDQVAIGGAALPWADRNAFADLMLSWDLRSYREAQAAAETGIVFFDRGIPDVIGYLQLSGLPVPPQVQRAAEKFRYNDRLFIAPPWPEIFTQDSERKQTIEEAEATYHAMADVYTGLGYELVTLPRLPVAERAAFVLSTCA
ncbi:AAA family ATPase [Hyphomicrobium sp. B1]|uniref:AAA family ATPase n=1 Tax=Hyphomicrobium sp. B1 TaxID=3075651 RepID=UPI003C2FC57B